MARPRKITKEVIKEFVSCLATGNPIRVACDKVGISRRTYNYWMSKGAEKKKGLLREFYLEVKESRSKLRRKAQANISKAIIGGDLGTSKWWVQFEEWLDSEELKRKLHKLRIEELERTGDENLTDMSKKEYDAFILAEAEKIKKEKEKK